MPPTTLNGSLHPSNRDAIAWNQRGLIAFGCHSTLCIFDVSRLEIVQTLEQHSTAINLVCWKSQLDLLRNAKSDDPHTADRVVNLRCASSDISGNIIVWDVTDGRVCASFRHLSTPVSDMHWFHWPDSGRDLLLSLHSNNLLILWDVAGKERLWEHKFSAPIFKFCIDPFDSSRMAFSSFGTSLFLAEDISPSRWPSGSNAIANLHIEPKTMRMLTAQNNGQTQIVQLAFHPGAEHLLFALFPNEICLVDAQHQQHIHSTAIDAGSPLAYILPCARVDAFFLVHQSGLISLRCARFSLSEERMSASLEYARRALSEPNRQSARYRLMGSALCPTTQSTLALLMSTGRIVIYQLGDASSQSLEPYRIRSIEDIVSAAEEEELPLENGVDGTNAANSANRKLRLIQYGVYNPLGSSVTVIRMRSMESSTAGGDFQQTDKVLNEAADKAPPNPFDNISHLAAVGTSTGVVHLVDVFSARICRDFQVHSCPVKCLEWSGPNSFISAAYLASLSASSSMVRNDVYATDIWTGAKRRIRPEQEESPIEQIRVSHYNCYLAISFRAEPLEIWDLRTLRLLRRMSKRCPIIVDMCWSSKHHQMSEVSQRTQIHKENLVVLDNDNHLYHVVVKGLHVRDGKEVSTQWKSGAAFLRCMVWKDDVLAFGDSAGRVGIWDLPKSRCRQTGLGQSTRGPVHRIVFSQLAGDFTLMAQHPSHIVLWDTERLHAIVTIQHPGHSIIDVDICGLTPVYIASDGMLRIALSPSERGRNSTLTNSDAPMLLRPSYRRTLHNLIQPEENEKLNENKKDGNRPDHDELLESDGDNAELLARLAECQCPLDRANFVHQFAGDLALADFGRIVKSAKMAKALKLNGGDVTEKCPMDRLPSNLMLFWEKEQYQKRVERLTRLLLSTFRTDRQLELAIERCVIMRKNDLAMFYLLNNDKLSSGSGRTEFDLRLNAFRACTLSASFVSEEARCLVKLTATNLIAANFVSDGIQLLSLIDQSLDACKYLISQGLWQRSLAYSKLSPQCEFEEIFVRYADYLSTEAVGRKSLALLFYAGGLASWDRCRTLIGDDPQLHQILKMAERTN